MFCCGVDYSWDSLKVSEATMKAIKEFGFEKMTPVQARCIPVCLVSSGRPAALIRRFLSPSSSSLYSKAAT